MAIDLVTNNNNNNKNNAMKMIQDTKLNNFMEQPPNHNNNNNNRTSSNNLHSFTNNTANELIELIKLSNKSLKPTTIRRHKANNIFINGAGTENIKKSSSIFSLTDLDFHSFHLRKLLRSLSSPPINNANNTTINNHHHHNDKSNNHKNIGKRPTLDSIQEQQSQENSIVSSNETDNGSRDIKLEMIVPNEQKVQEPNNDKTDEKEDTNDNKVNDVPNLVKKGSSTETLKLEDQIVVQESTQIISKEDACSSSSSSSLNNEIINYNEDILETLRQVLRMCTKMDMSKRASAQQIHGMLKDKLMETSLSTIDGKRSNHQTILPLELSTIKSREDQRVEQPHDQDQRTSNVNELELEQKDSKD